MIRNNTHYELFASHTVPNPDQVGYWIDLGANSKGKIVKVYNENLRQWVKVLDASSEDAVSPFIGSNGNWWVDNRDTGIPAAGKNPYIGENGNWYVYDPLSKKFTDTGVVAKGRSAYDLAVESGFKGTEEEWIDSLKQPALDAAQVALDAAERANEEVDKLQDIYEQVTNALDLATQATENANTAAQSANDAADRSNLIASNPPKIVNETWYMFDEETNEYVSTGIKAIGDAFTIAKTYASVEAMQADYNNPEVGIGQFVMIDTGDVDNPEDSQLYLKGDTEWKFISDLSGAQGIQGLSAYQIAVQEGFIGSEEDWIASLKGEKGDTGNKGDKGDAGEKGDPFVYSDFTPEQLESLKGQKGDPGNAATVTVGETVTLEPGSDALVENTGNENVAVLKFSIPKGEKGDKGDKGDTGEGVNIKGELSSESELPEEGQPGDAYIIDGNLYVYVGDGGSVVSNPKWSNVGNIKGEPGPQGEPGADGKDGAAATIEIGTVSSSEPGTEPTVTNSGNSTNAIFNFTIPKGEKGDKGEQVDAVDWANITSKPDFKTVATTGSYNDLTDKPTIPTLDGYATESWVTEQGYLTEHQDISNLATKSEVATKANSADVYTKSQTYTQDEIDSAIKQASATVFKYKGTVANYSSLPTEGVFVGDVYTLQDTNEEYVATADSPSATWEYLGVKVDLSDYSTTEQNDSKYQPKGDYAVKSDIADMETKTNAAATYQPKGEYLTSEDQDVVNIFDMYVSDLNHGTISSENLQKLNNIIDQNKSVKITGTKDGVFLDLDCICIKYFTVIRITTYLCVDSNKLQYTIFTINGDDLTVTIDSRELSYDSNVTENAKLNGYAKVSSTSDITETDTINSAIGKLEYKLNNKIEEAPSDDASYARKNKSWIKLDNYILDAPADDNFYIRQNNDWQILKEATSATAGLLSSSLYTKLQKMKIVKDLPISVLSLTDSAIKDEIVSAFGFDNANDFINFISTYSSMFTNEYEQSKPDKIFIGNYEVIVSGSYDESSKLSIVNFTYIYNKVIKTLSVSVSGDIETEIESVKVKCKVTENSEEVTVITVSTNTYPDDNSKVTISKELYDKIVKSVENYKPIVMQTTCATFYMQSTYKYTASQPLVLFFSFHQIDSLGSNALSLFVNGYVAINQTASEDGSYTATIRIVKPIYEIKDVDFSLPNPLINANDDNLKDIINLAKNSNCIFKAKNGSYDLYFRVVYSSSTVILKSEALIYPDNEVVSDYELILSTYNSGKNAKAEYRKLNTLAPADGKAYVRQGTEWVWLWDAFYKEYSSGGIYPELASNGIYILHTNGFLYKEEDWTFNEEGVSADDGPAVGIAIITDDCRIVMHYSYTFNASFGGEGTLISDITTTTTISDAMLDFNGETNTDKIIEQLGEGNAPLAEECRSITFKNGKKGYLPAFGELYAIATNYPNIITCLKKINSDSYMNSYFSCSTQYDADKNWKIYLSDTGGSVTGSTSSKSTENTTYPVCKL